MTIPDKDIRLRRSVATPAGHRRPVMLAIAGDSAAGKTTLTRGIAEALGADRATALCVDDYHRYDGKNAADVPFTVLHPDCNYIEVMEQHLQLLALGQADTQAGLRPRHRCSWSGRCWSSRATS